MFRTVTSFVCAAAVTTAIAVAQSEPAIVTAARTQDTGGADVPRGACERTNDPANLGKGHPGIESRPEGDTALGRQAVRIGHRRIGGGSVGVRHEMSEAGDHRRLDRVLTGGCVHP